MPDQRANRTRETVSEGPRLGHFGWATYALHSQAEREFKMRAYCPYCKAEVSVIPRLKEKEALQYLSEGKRIELKHVGSDGDHVFMSEKVRDTSKGVK
jgi:hypothetical protein